MTLQLLHSEFVIYEDYLIFFFISAGNGRAKNPSGNCIDGHFYRGGVAIAYQKRGTQDRAPNKITLL
jgi:hypothetical protein